MGKRVKVSVVEKTIEDEDDGHEGPGVEATCLECNHKTQSFGQTDRSIRRCLVLMRDECPAGLENFYVDEDA